MFHGFTYNIFDPSVRILWIEKMSAIQLTSPQKLHRKRCFMLILCCEYVFQTSQITILPVIEGGQSPRFCVPSQSEYRNNKTTNSHRRPDRTQDEPPVSHCCPSGCSGYSPFFPSEGEGGSGGGEGSGYSGVNVMSPTGVLALKTFSGSCLISSASFTMFSGSGSCLCSRGIGCCSFSFTCLFSSLWADLIF